jgi:Spy/CpxP family protein refolding chaperone
MNTVAKNKLLTWLVILLLVANAASIAMFWLSRGKNPPPPKGTPQEFLVKELKLDSKQQEQFDSLRKEHRQAADQLREKIKAAKESFFDLLKQTNVSDSLKQSTAKAVSLFTEELDLLTLNHFQKIRSLCTPEQQKKFDEIIQQVTSMMAPPHPPAGPGGRQGPPPDGPPPPRE